MDNVKRLWTSALPLDKAKICEEIKMKTTEIKPIRAWAVVDMGGIRPHAIMNYDEYFRYKYGERYIEVEIRPIQQEWSNVSICDVCNGKGCYWSNKLDTWVTCPCNPISHDKAEACNKDDKLPDIYSTISYSSSAWNTSEQWHEVYCGGEIVFKTRNKYEANMFEAELKNKLSGFQGSREASKDNKIESLEEKVKELEKQVSPILVNELHQANDRAFSLEAEVARLKGRLDEAKHLLLGHHNRDADQVPHFYAQTELYRRTINLLTSLQSDHIGEANENVEPIRGNARNGEVEALKAKLSEARAIMKCVIDYHDVGDVLPNEIKSFLSSLNEADKTKEKTYGGFWICNYGVTHKNGNDCDCSPIRGNDRNGDKTKENG